MLAGTDTIPAAGGVAATSMSSVLLYYMPESPPCRAVQMLAAQIGLPLDLKYINLDTQEQKSPEFTRVNPQQVVPTIRDGDFTLWESRAILKYLVLKFACDSPLYPSDLKRRAKVDQVLDFDIGMLYASLGLFLVPLLYGKPTNPEGEARFRQNLTTFNDMLVDGFACGSEMTIADISLVAGLSFADTILYDFSPWPRVCEWKECMRSRVTQYADINDKAMAGFVEYMKEKQELVRRSQQGGE